MSIKTSIKIIKTVFAKDSFRILAFAPTESCRDIELNKYGNATIKGEYPFLEDGKEYKDVELDVISRDNYGTAYKIVNINLDNIDIAKLSRDEKYSILRTITTSDAIANNIINAYPNFIELVVNKSDEELKELIDLKNIKGVGEVYFGAYKRMLREKYKYLAYIMKYKDYDVDITDCKLLFDAFFEEKAIDKNFNERPYYVLIEVLGRSFEKADKLILSLREDLRESDQRVEFMELDILGRNEVDGSTRLNGSVLFDVAHDYGMDELLPRLKDVAVNSELIYYDETTKDLSKMSTYIAECNIADFVKNKVENPQKLDIDWHKYTSGEDFEMTEEQSELLRLFCEYDIVLLNGGAGMGKTFSVKGLINLMEDNNLSYTLLSTTGKAGRVLSQSVHRNASTIHRKCFTETIDTDVIIVDEFSMCSLDVMTMLLNAVTNENAKFVFVFDIKQLPPIGLGKIAYDFYNCEYVPKVVLTKVFRYKSSGNLFSATNIGNGKSFLDDEEMVKYSNNCYSVGGNYKFIETSEDDIFDTVMSEYLKLIKKGAKKENIVVLCPMNKSQLGTYAINNAIQSEINPPKKGEIIQTRKVGNFNIVFRVGDLVMNTKNNYKIVTYEGYKEMKEDSILTENDVETSVVLNGQVGIVREVLNDGLIAQFDEELLFFGKSNLQNLLLSYCITQHKSQGSTFEHTIGITTKQHGRMLNRALCYVGATRCSADHIEIGQRDIFESSLLIDENLNTNTWLPILLVENLKNGKVNTIEN